MADFYLRTESIKQDEIIGLSVLNGNDREIISALRSTEPCLIEGSRGTGKSFLMRVAQLKLEADKTQALPVFVSFNISSLINSSDPLQFYHWMLAKTLKSMLNTLRKKGLSISSHIANLLSNDENNDERSLEVDLKSIVRQFESSYKTNSEINIDSLPDIEDVKDAIETICIENNLDRVFFFFDEAAHVFRPKQQRQFFSLFKDLRSPYITCNAAIYPGVTYFGDSFEPNHDCIYKKLDRKITDSDYIEYFKTIVFKQADQVLKDSIESNMTLFITLALSCGGNPRILLKTIQDLNKFNTSGVNQIIKEFYRGQIWSEHTELGEKYRGHKLLIDWGRDFVERSIIPAIQAYNTKRKERNVSESSIYFWIHKDSPETVKESLRLLSYMGIVRKLDSSVRATRAELGSRFEVKYGCVIALNSSPVAESKDFFDSLSIKKFPEFGKNHSSYSGISQLQNSVEDESTFLES